MTPCTSLHNIQDIHGRAIAEAGEFMALLAIVIGLCTHLGIVLLHRVFTIIVVVLGGPLIQQIVI